MTSMLTTAEAASFLGISSRATIENWLQGGHFPGAIEGLGRWWFGLKELEEVKARIEVIRAKNTAGDSSFDFEEFETVLDRDEQIAAIDQQIKEKRELLSTLLGPLYVGILENEVVDLIEKKRALLQQGTR